VHCAAAHPGSHRVTRESDRPAVIRPAPCRPRRIGEYHRRVGICCRSRR
jgi:hypothetical protein